MIFPLLALLWACGARTECDRSGDADCDGVPDLLDRCADSNGEPKDAAGCTDDQAAGCTVVIEAPDDGERTEAEATFDWHGTCDVYLLQFSSEPTFVAARTRTETRTSATRVTTRASEPYWRVVGGRSGSSRSYTTEPREIRWR